MGRTVSMKSKMIEERGTSWVVRISMMIVSSKGCIFFGGMKVCFLT